MAVGVVVVGGLGGDAGQGQGEDVVGGVQRGVEHLRHYREGVGEEPDPQLHADHRHVHPENELEDPPDLTGPLGRVQGCGHQRTSVVK